MHAPKKQTRTVQAPPEAVFNAVLGIAQRPKPYTLVGVNNEAQRIVFSRGLTGLTWGAIYLVGIEPAAGGVDVTVTVGGRDDAPKALLDGWKHNRAGAKWLDELEAVLAGTELAPHTPVESFLQLTEDERVPWTTDDFPLP